MTNLEGILKSRDVTLPTKVCLVKAMASSVHVWAADFSSSPEGWDAWKVDAWRMFC